MDWTIFQLGCLVVLVVAYTWLIRDAGRRSDEPRRARRDMAISMVLIAVTAWAAEETSILQYRHYHYPDGWWVRLDEMPLIPTLIWPVLILSSRALVDHLFPGLSPLKKALAVGLAVIVDATLIETVAVTAGLWVWVDGGYLGAPLVAIFSWGAFAAPVVFAFEHPKIPRWASPLVALAGTHALIVASWWIFFRHTLRDDLPSWTVAINVVAMVGLAVWLRRRGRRIDMNLAAPRLVATTVFIALLITHASVELVINFVAVVIPYLVIFEPRGEPRGEPRAGSVSRAR